MSEATGGHQDPYLVVGTGRSGTSFVSRILHEYLGVYMGKVFRPTNRNNPDGTYEDAEFSDLNKSWIFGRLTYNEYDKQLVRLIEERRSLDRQWGVKDPLLAYILGTWLSLFDKPRIIRCRRKPELVIGSLMRCYGYGRKEAEEFFYTREASLDRSLEGRKYLEIRFGDEEVTSEAIVTMVSRFFNTKRLYVAILNRGKIRRELIQVIEWIKGTSGVEVTLENPTRTVGHPICCNRAKIMRRCLEKKPRQDFLLMLDNDVVPQTNPAMLVWADKDIIGMPAPIRTEGRGIQMVSFCEHPLHKEGYAPLDFAGIDQGSDLVECDAIGTGCILIRRNVLEALKDKQAFAVVLNPKTGELEYGTDIAFSYRARKAGFKIYSTVWTWAEHMKEVGLLDITGYDYFMWRDPVAGKYRMPWGGENGYSVIQKDWTFIKGIIKRNKIRRVAEFGCGLSTFLMSELVDEVMSYEDESAWIKNFKKQGIEAYDRGLENIKKIKVKKWDGYEIEMDGRYDLVFVDGPRGRAAGGPIGRRHSIRLASQMADRVIVHDAGRTDEQNWQLQYLRPDFIMSGMSGYHQGRANYWVRKSLLENKDGK